MEPVDFNYVEIIDEVEENHVNGFIYDNVKNTFEITFVELDIDIDERIKKEELEEQQVDNFVI